MKAITLWQPWASLIAEGVKTIETRSWPCPEWMVGERIAIHAAKRKPMPGPIWRTWDPLPVPLPLGAIVATARLVDCLPMVDAVSAIGERSAYLEVGRNLNYAHVYRPGDPAPTRCTDQLPYGDFAPGRWAWLLDDIEKLPDPIPAKGRQRIWNWEAA